MQPRVVSIHQQQSRKPRFTLGFVFFALDIEDQNLKHIFLFGSFSLSLSQADIFVVINHFLIPLEDFNSVQLKAQWGCDPELGVDKVFASVCCPH